MDFFIDQDTTVKIYAPLNESLVDCSSLRSQDLYEGLLTALKDTAEYVSLSSQVPAYAAEDNNSEWWESEDCRLFMDELYETLESYAPEGFYFGSHPGNGSDFGYWKNEEEDTRKSFRITWRHEVNIQAESLDEAKEIWEALNLSSLSSEKVGNEFVELISVEGDNYEDLLTKFKR